MLRYRWLLLCLPFAALWSGCQAPGMGGIDMVVPISGGQKINVPLTRQGPLKAENADLAVTNATLIADIKTKQCAYLFSFIEKHHFGLRRVTVEDVSDDQPVVMCDDTHPTVGQHNDWHVLTPKFTPTPDNIHWLMEVDYNMRIYRFTVVKDDGQTDVLYNAQDYGNPIKHFFRVGFGLEKPEQPLR